MTAPEQRGPGVFISYRRGDVPGHAGRLYDRLSQRFGESRVFMDVDSIEIGVDFVATLMDAVASCKVMLVLIGPQWLAGAQPSAQSRLDDPNDYVRIEVQTALERGVRVVPVLVQGARVPASEQLPEPLQPLVRRQAVELGDATFQSDARQLIERLGPVLGDAASPQAPDSPVVRSAPVSSGAPWQATCRRIGRLLFHLDVTLSWSSHVVEFQFHDLRANEVRVDGKGVPIANDRLTLERYESTVTDGPETRQLVVEARLGMLSPKAIVLAVDGRELYHGL